MKLKLILGLTFIFYYLCGSLSHKSISKDDLQKALFDTLFNYEDIKSINIIEIEHPMLGGILSSQTLSKQQQKLFIEKIKNLEPAGIYKCASKYIIRIIFSKDIIRLKTCDEMITNRTSDSYFFLSNNSKIISDFIQY